MDDKEYTAPDFLYSYHLYIDLSLSVCMYFHNGLVDSYLML